MDTGAPVEVWLLVVQLMSLAWLKAHFPEK